MAVPPLACSFAIRRASVCEVAGERPRRLSDERSSSNEGLCGFAATATQASPLQG
jgi:hypothetical protein